MKRIKIFNLLIIILSIFVLSSCAFIQKHSTKIKVVTTLFPEYDMINKIIGSDEVTKDIFEVKLIIPPGQDSHTYDPSVKDLLTIKNADIFIYTTDEMEAWVKDIDFSEKTKVVNLSLDERIVLERVEDDAEHHNLVENEGDHNHTHVHAYDPHYWIYPVYAIYMVEQIRDILLNSIQDPYEMIGLAMINNANKYIDALNKIDHQLQYIANNATKKTMYFGSPFSFFYWHTKYGFEYELTYSTCSTETEPPISVLSDIIEKMRQNNIKYIFSKELLNDEACKTISFHTGAEIITLHSGHNVSVEDFNNKEVSFITILQQDVINLSKMLEVDMTKYEEREIM